jgi:hypothetical protein
MRPPSAPAPPLTGSQVFQKAEKYHQLMRNWRLPLTVRYPTMDLGWRGGGGVLSYCNPLLYTKHLFEAL